MNENEAFDPQQFKAEARDSWSRAAIGWNVHTPQIRRWLANATSAMLDAANILPGSCVVDVAAGAGDQTLDAARRVGPNGYVLATDISPNILHFAATNARGHGFDNVQTMVADAENLNLPAASFDAAICRLGLMFCPDPKRSLQEIHHALKPGSRVSVLVYSQVERNPCLAIVMQTALEYAGLPWPDPYMPGTLFSLSRPGDIGELFASAKFHDITTSAIPAAFSLPSAFAYVEFIRTSTSSVMRLLGMLTPSAREAALLEMESRLRQFQTPSGWEGPNELLLTAGAR
ncbi:methyltransferase domain-containing protein [Candidimonas sp. SYP-B2681]|uniref:class I SAM-dependent methyltransferase n=1 Tax=Candidimonas sp. SYP-B2681 TaxID=2497686 RepID=UPI000F884473|nr:class I SAM-dependent methyltransferase [Candidimonas sp. SYP-B2681]RTZ44550.1 methyltransferase domain-containing protein [Candidimonas sp. SYP-B2681]